MSLTTSQARIEKLQSDGWEKFSLITEDSPTKGPDGWLIAAKFVNQSVIEFIAFDIVASEMDGTAMFSLHDGNGSQFTSEPDEAEVFAEGIVKWDGHTEIDFPNGMYHSGHGGAKMAGRFFEKLAEIADQMMPDTSGWRLF